jgi:small multidrug resistance pump
MKYILLSLAVLFNTSAYLLFKYISGKQNDLLWYAFFSVGLLAGAINTFLFTLSLREINLGIAYPIFSAASITCIVLISTVFFNEKSNLNTMCGALIAVIGIVLMTR